MKIAYAIAFPGNRKRILKLLLMTKFSVVMLLACLQVSAKSYSQLVTLSKKRVSIDVLLREVKQQTGYDAFYEEGLSSELKPVDIHVKSMPLKEVLDLYFKGQPAVYFIENKTIVVKAKPESGPPPPVVQDTGRLVRGKITGELGEPVGGATISVVGGKISVAASPSGDFSINLPEGKNWIRISSVGYVDTAIDVKNVSAAQVVLRKYFASSSDVVVIAYGTAKKRDVVGSMSTITAAEVNQLPVASVDAALQGKGGLLAMTSGGTPGAPVKVLIRGTNSISSGTDPLYIVDGIPLTMSVSSGLGDVGSVDQSALSTINANDIQSIEVLKDAAATAIYGSRGSNGVILITTKSGKGKNGGLSVYAATGTSDLSRTPGDIGWTNTKEFFGLVDQARANSGLPPFDPAIVINSWVGNKEYITRDQALNTQTDWFNQIMRKGSYQEYNLATSKSADRSSLYASLNYRTDNGVMKTNRLQRYSARVNADFTPLNHLTTGFRISLSYTDNHRSKDEGYGSTSGSEGNGGGFAAANNMAMPFYPIYSSTNESGYWNPQAGFNLTALNDPRLVRDQQEIYRAIGGGYTQFEFPWVKGLSIRSEYAMDFLQSNSVNWISKYLRPEDISAGMESGRSIINYNYNLYLNFNRSFGEHSIAAAAGTESQRSWVVEKQLKGDNTAGVYQELGTPLGLQTFFSGLDGERYLRAFFGRADYKFKDRYLVGASMRRDGSSAFPANNRWANFASLGLGWIMSDEKFWDIKPVNFFKLRGSFGQTGNQSIPNIIGGAQWGDGYRYGLIGNTPNGSYLQGVNATNLTWETTNSIDGGIDFGLLHNRITGSLVYYHKTVKNMLLLSPTPSASGVDNTWQNIGSMRNTGWEVSLEGTPVTAGDFKWKTGFNITFNANKVLNLTQYVDQNHTGILDDITITRTGGKLGTYFLSEYAGVDPDHGVEMIQEIDRARYLATGETVKTGNLIPSTLPNNTDHKIVENGKTGLPTYWGGFNNTFSYKGLDLTFFFTFQGGNWIYDEGEREGTSVAQGAEQLRKEMIGNTWQKPGDHAKFAQLVWDETYPWDMDLTTHKWITANGNYNNGTIFNDKYLYKGDFVRLKTLQLGYNLPTAWMTRIGLKSARLAVSATNLFTITKYKGYDPEAINNTDNLEPGLIHYQVPNLRIFSVSATINL